MCQRGTNAVCCVTPASYSNLRPKDKNREAHDNSPVSEVMSIAVFPAPLRLLFICERIKFETQVIVRSIGPLILNNTKVMTSQRQEHGIKFNRKYFTQPLTSMCLRLAFRNSANDLTLLLHVTVTLQ